MINFDKFVLSPEKSILAISNKIKCRFVGNIKDHIKSKPSKNIKDKFDDDQISQIYKLLLDKCINWFKKLFNKVFEFESKSLL